ncbi:MAG TPA: class I tRNA ligase family protein, partial [Candidatus Omnitrophota bacterium]|nr:class I tRNA ligase family protein [Candidatus Omnitrophota bacterium]
ERWILHNLNSACEEVSECFGKYRFNDAAARLYDFIWHKYCDWFLEISKLSRDKARTGRVLMRVLKTSMQLLHPIMPFLTEAVWQMTRSSCPDFIAVSKWPGTKSEWMDEQSSVKMEKIISCVSAVRNIRAFWNVGLSVKLDVHFDVTSVEDEKLITENSYLLEKLASCSVCSSGIGTARPDKSVAAIVGGLKLFVPLGTTVDIDQEKKRVKDKIAEIERYLKGVEKKLSNQDFVSKAPREVVEKEKNKIVKFRQEADNLIENLEALV